MNGAVPIDGILQRPVFFQDHVEVGAAETKGAYPGTPRRSAAGQPWALLVREVERGAAAGYLVQRFLYLDGRGEHLVVEGQGRLDQAGRAG